MLNKFKTCGNVFFLILFFYGTNQFAAAQKKTTGGQIALANFEKSIEQGNLVEIERLLLDLAIANPQNPKVLALLARLRFRQNRLSEAESLYRRVLTLDPNAVSAKINFARLVYDAGRTDEARQMLNEAAAQNINAETEIQLNLAAALAFVGEFQKSLAAIDRLPVKIKNFAALPVAATDYLALNDRRKLNELLPQMKKAATDPALAIQNAEVLQKAEMTGESADLLRAALTFNAQNAGVLLALGTTEIGAKDFAQAKAHLSRAAALQPRAAEVYSAQARLENAQGNALKAFELLERARELKPDSPPILADFAVAAMRVNRPREAVEAAQKLLTLKPDESEYQYLFGAASLQNGNIAAAQESLENFARLRPLDSRGCLALGLTLAAQSDRLAAAQSQLSHCLEIDPKNYEAKYQLALSYKTQGDTAKAIRLLEEVNGQNPNYAAALRDLGALYLQSGDEKKARDVLEKSAALDSNDADTHFQLSRLYNLIGEPALAKQHFEMFQRLKNPPGKSMQ